MENPRRDMQDGRPRKRWIVPVLLLLGMTVALVVFADNNDKKNDEKSSTYSNDAVTPNNAANRNAASKFNGSEGRFAPVNATYRGYKLTELLGESVKNLEDKDLGKVEDLVINMNNGAVRYAILSFGGLMGVGDDWYAIPIRDLRPEVDGDDLVANLDKDRLENSKKFAKDRWPSEMGYWDDADRVHGISPASAPAAQPSKTSSAFRAKDLLGKDVRSLDKKTGTIKDLVIDMNGQEVQYVVLERTDEYNGSLVAVPLSSLSMNAGDRDMRLALDGARLKSMHGYNSANWPDPNDRNALSAFERDWNETVEGTSKPN